MITGEIATVWLIAASDWAVTVETPRSTVPTIVTALAGHARDHRYPYAPPLTCGYYGKTHGDAQMLKAWQRYQVNHPTGL